MHEQKKGNNFKLKSLTLNNSFDFKEVKYILMMKWRSIVSQKTNKKTTSLPTNQPPWTNVPCWKVWALHGRKSRVSCIWESLFTRLTNLCWRFNNEWQASIFARRKIRSCRCTVHSSWLRLEVPVRRRRQHHHICPLHSLVVADIFKGTTTKYRLVSRVCIKRRTQLTKAEGKKKEEKKHI